MTMMTTRMKSEAGAPSNRLRASAGAEGLNNHFCFVHLGLRVVAEPNGALLSRRRQTRAHPLVSEPGFRLVRPFRNAAIVDPLASVDRIGFLDEISGIQIGIKGAIGVQLC